MKNTLSIYLNLLSTPLSQSNFISFNFQLGSSTVFFFLQLRYMTWIRRDITELQRCASVLYISADTEPEQGILKTVCKVSITSSLPFFSVMVFVTSATAFPIINISYKFIDFDHLRAAIFS